MGIARNQTIYKTRMRSQMKRNLEWQYFPYGNQKAEIQDKKGVIAIVRNLAIAKHICNLQHQFCSSESDRDLNRLQKAI